MACRLKAGEYAALSRGNAALHALAVKLAREAVDGADHCQWNWRAMADAERCQIVRNEVLRLLDRFDPVQAKSVEMTRSHACRQNPAPMVTVRYCQRSSDLGPLVEC
ncbi:hypothetical protein JI59_04865 [Novosphingobium pentaromativorans US6-1]|jgi:hypothetical protein|nr:hypothetical protein JI59_04865 [Novosphingobium pentaromativorans US6-1]